MKKLFVFLRLRKQYDSIKFALILFVCAVFFLTSGIIQIVSYASYLNKPCEYILDAYSASATLDIGIEIIKETEGAVSASFQRDYVVMSKNDAVLVVSELSAEYLSECYGIESTGNGKKIWLSSVAFDEFAGKTDENSVRLTYSVDGKKESAEFIKCEALDFETAYAVSVGTTASLDGSTVVRVMFDNIDVSGSNTRHLEDLGYGISNREDMIIESHEQDMTLSEVKHYIISTVLSFLGVFAFVRVYDLEKADSLP